MDTRTIRGTATLTALVAACGAGEPRVDPGDGDGPPAAQEGAQAGSLGEVDPGGSCACDLADVWLELAAVRAELDGAAGAPYWARAWSPGPSVVALCGSGARLEAGGCELDSGGLVAGEPVETVGPDYGWECPTAPAGDGVTAVALCELR